MVSVAGRTFSLRSGFAAVALSLTVGVASVAGAASAQDRRQNQPGQFDFYVLSLSWSPSFCEAAGERGTPPQQQCGARPYSFVVHGLWPQYEKGFPEFCQQSRRRGSTATSCPPCSI
jgi:ribonuclease T2